VLQRIMLAENTYEQEACFLRGHNLSSMVREGKGKTEGGGRGLLLKSVSS